MLERFLKVKSFGLHISKPKKYQETYFLICEARRGGAEAEAEAMAEARRGEARRWRRGGGVAKPMVGRTVFWDRNRRKTDGPKTQKRFREGWADDMVW